MTTKSTKSKDDDYDNFDSIKKDILERYEKLPQWEKDILKRRMT